MTTISKVRYSRRSMLKAGGAAIAASALPAPMVWGQETANITLRRFESPAPSRTIAMVWRSSSALSGFLREFAQSLKSLPPKLLELS